MYLREMNCCGMREMADLEFTDNAKSAMEEFIMEAIPVRDHYNWKNNKYEKLAELRFSHVVFSEAKDGSGNYGENFAAFIRRHRLGTVVASQRRRNPNSGNLLKFWVWTLNKRGLVRWANQNKVRGNTRYSILD